MTMTDQLPTNRKENIQLKRFSRLSAWALLAAVVVLVVSGWGITQTGVIYHLTFGLIDRGAANTIHRHTNVPLAAFFLTHVLINIKLMFSRSTSAPAWLTNAIIIILGAGIMAAFVYMEYFRLGG
jgi:hypothetical protein